ncbi:MAG: hypothetical protein MZV70_07765 [Desulfobacterales bacterium]|nr:hypothetical protein [Desulfobacterales bacterium]
MTTGEGAVGGGLFGGLIGALLAAPFTGGATAAAALAVGSLSGVALGATLRRDRRAGVEGRLRHLGRLRPARRGDGSTARFGGVRAGPDAQSGPRRRGLQGLRRHRCCARR